MSTQSCSCSVEEIEADWSSALSYGLSLDRLYSILAELKESIRAWFFFSLFRLMGYKVWESIGWRHLHTLHEIQVIVLNQNEIVMGFFWD